MEKPTKIADLVVLGLLNEKPRYGYEIKTIIDHVMTHIIDVSSGSLYYTLKKLREQGLVEESAIEKVGRRPERAIYQITDTGKALLDRDLPGVIYPHAQPFFPLDLALYFYQFLDQQAAARRVAMRKAHLARVLEHVIGMENQYDQEIPEEHQFITRHYRMYNQMEATFLDEVQRKLIKLDYKLTEADRAEVESNFQQVISTVKYETVLNGNGNGQD